MLENDFLRELIETEVVSLREDIKANTKELKVHTEWLIAMTDDIEALREAVNNMACDYKQTPRKESCQTCDYSDLDITPSGQISSVRFPEPLDKSADSWCGEYFNTTKGD